MLMSHAQNKSTIKRNVQISFAAIAIAAALFVGGAQAQEGHRRHDGGNYSRHQNQDPSRHNQAPYSAPNGGQDDGEHRTRRNHPQPLPQTAPVPPTEQRSHQQHYWPHQTPRLPENGDNEVTTQRHQPAQQPSHDTYSQQRGDGNRGHSRQYDSGYRQHQPSQYGNYGNQQQNQSQYGNQNRHYEQPRQQQHGHNYNYGNQNNHNSYGSNRHSNYRHYEFQNRNHDHNRMGPYGNWQRWDNRWGNANDYARRWGFDGYDPYNGWRRGNRWYSHPSQWSDWGGWYSFFFGSSGLWGYSYNSGYDPYLNNYGNSCQRVETIEWIRSNRAVVSFVACRNRWGNWEEISGTREFQYWLY